MNKTSHKESPQNNYAIIIESLDTFRRAHVPLLHTNLPEAVLAAKVQSTIERNSIIELVDYDRLKGGPVEEKQYWNNNPFGTNRWCSSDCSQVLQNGYIAEGYACFADPRDNANDFIVPTSLGDYQLRVYVNCNNEDFLIKDITIDSNFYGECSIKQYMTEGEMFVLRSAIRNKKKYRNERSLKHEQNSF